MGNIEKSVSSPDSTACQIGDSGFVSTLRPPTACRVLGAFEEKGTVPGPKERHISMTVPLNQCGNKGQARAVGPQGRGRVQGRAYREGDL